MTSPALGIGVISIDLGTEWLKMGLVKRGVAADMVLNNESKRKTPFAISISEKERLFGGPAKSVVCNHVVLLSCVVSAHCGVWDWDSIRRRGLVPLVVARDIRGLGTTRLSCGVIASRLSVHTGT